MGQRGTIQKKKRIVNPEGGGTQNASKEGQKRGREEKEMQLKGNPGTRKRRKVL